MKRGCLFIVALLMAIAVSAQKAIVSGTVVSTDTGRPVEGASVTAAGLAVVTNSDGFFTLKSDTVLSSITVTHLGYRAQRVTLGDKQEGELKVRLRPTAIELQEVLVMADNPRALVLEAISRIPKNYSQQPELYHCFYRETAMKRQHYICVAEGVVDMYKTRYGHSDYRDRVAIIKGRRLLSPKSSDTLSVKVIGGPVTPVQLDVAKNTDLLLNEEELDCYDLRMESPTSIGDRMQYVVSITPRKKMPYPLYFGNLYIDQETLAFTRAVLLLDMRDRNKATQMMLVKKPAGVRFRPKELSVLVDYRQGADGLTRISYIRTTFRFNSDWRRRLFATSFTAFCEMAVTSKAEGEAKPIRGRQSFDQRDAFFDRVDYFRDPTFWQDYNIIEPTETLDRAINKLLKR